MITPLTVQGYHGTVISLNATMFMMHVNQDSRFSSLTNSSLQIGDVHGWIAVYYVFNILPITQIV
jgi:hypothetical protein